jgi:hypothetical protein
METATIDQVLAHISQHLHLSKETEYEVLEEIRTHLEDVIAEAASRGEDEQAALQQAAAEFGIEEAGDELQKVHANWEALGPIGFTALPVLFALILRWLVFAPDGSAAHWLQVLDQPVFLTLAIAAMIIPAYLLHLRRLALVGWGVFWLLTIIFVIFPSINHW